MGGVKGVVGWTGGFMPGSAANPFLSALLPPSWRGLRS